MIRVIIFLAVALLIIFGIRLIKLMTQFRSGSRTTNIDDLKDKASHIKNKYKNLEEADFRDITPSDEESDPSKENNAR